MKWRYVWNILCNKYAYVNCIFVGLHIFVMDFIATWGATFILIVTNTSFIVLDIYDIDGKYAELFCCCVFLNIMKNSLQT